MTPLLASGRTLATLVEVSERTVDRWVALGLPHVRIGRLVRFEVDEVLAWLRAQGGTHARGATSAAPPEPPSASPVAARARHAARAAAARRASRGGA